MRASKRQLDACGHQPPVTRSQEPETGQQMRFAIEVQSLLDDEWSNRLT